MTSEMGNGSHRAKSDPPSDPHVIVPEPPAEHYHHDDAGSDLGDDDRNPMDSLADEFVERYRRGEQPSVSEYASRFPDLADDIRTLFPTIVAMERLKHSKLESGSGRASLGRAKLHQLGDFRILREIGRGGMGIVYEAVQESLGRHVAIKVLPQQSLLEPKQLTRFQREAQTAARLHHTNIVPVFGVGHQDGFHFYAMQYIRGVGLDVVLAALRDRSNHADPNEPTRSLAAELSGASAARALLDGRFAVPRRPGSNTDPSASRSSASRPSSPNRPRSDAPRSDAPGSDALGHTEDRCSANPELVVPVSGQSAGEDDRPRQDPSGDSATSSGVTTVLGGITGHRNSGSGTRRSRQYWRSVAQIGIQVADALQYAHQQGALHRDIKPANLLLDAQGAVWVTDFGLAKATEHDNVTRTGDIVGTLRYMAPEQFDGVTDARGDTYSLGLTLYELLTFRPAFGESNRSKLIQQVSQGEPPRPRQICGDVPRDLETIVLKAISRDPADRYESAAALCQDLQRFLEDRTILARRPNPAERLWRWCRRNQAVAALTLTAFAATTLAAIAGWTGYVRTNDALGQVQGKHEQAVQATTRAERNLNQARLATDRAEANLSLALRAFDDVFDQIGGRDTFNLIEDPEAAAAESPTEVVVDPAEAELLQRMLVFYDQFAVRNQGDEQLQRETARANRRLGDIHRQMGNREAAETAYLRALELYEALPWDRNSSTYLEVATLQNRIGRLRSRHRDIEGAISAYREAERLLNLAGTSANRAGPYLPAARRELARTYYHLASTASWRSWRTYSDLAIALLDKIIAEQPDQPESRLTLARVKLDRARRGSRGSRPEPTLTAEAVGLLRQLVDDYPQNTDFQYELASAFVATSSWRSKPEIRPLRQQKLQEAVTILNRLSRANPSSVRYERLLIWAHQKLASIHAAEEQMDAALFEYEAAVETAHGLVQRNDQDQGCKMLLSWSLLVQADFHKRQDQYEEAMLVLEHSIDIAESVDDSVRHFDSLPRRYGLMASMLRTTGEDARAEKYQQMAETLRKKASQRSVDRSRRTFGRRRQTSNPTRPPASETTQDGPMPRQDATDD